MEEVLTKVTKIFHIVRRETKYGPSESPKKSFHIYELHASLFEVLLFGGRRSGANHRNEHLININNLFRKVLEAGIYAGKEDLKACMAQEVNFYLCASWPSSNSSFSLEFDKKRQYQLEISLDAIGRRNLYKIVIRAVQRPWGNTLQERAIFQVARMAKSKENIGFLKIPTSVKEELSQFYEVPTSPAGEDEDILLQRKSMIKTLVQALDEVKNYTDGHQLVLDKDAQYEKLFNALTKSMPDKTDLCRSALDEAFRIVYLNKEDREDYFLPEIVQGLIETFDVANSTDRAQIDLQAQYAKIFDEFTKKWPDKIDFYRRALNEAYRLVYWTNEVVHKI